MSLSTCSTSGDVSILVGGCRIRGAANNRPITVTDVQSDGRPRDVPGDSLSAQHLRAAAAAARLHRRRHGAEAVGRQQPHVAILARQVPRIRANSLSPTRHLSWAWFSPLSMRCLRPCTPPVRLFSVYSLRVQPSIRQSFRKCPYDI
eukprot:scaffold26301_cov132-Isochrysis_galbana.AAC.1